MSDIEVYTDSDGRFFLFKLHLFTLINLMGQTAASLIVACQDYPFDGSPPTQSPIGSVLASRMEGWERPEFTSTLLSQAQFLYACVGHIVGCGQSPSVMSREVANLVADALAHFQEWKMKLCRAEQDEHGEHWGTGTGFYKANWTDRNKKFLTLWG